MFPVRGQGSQKCRWPMTKSRGELRYAMRPSRRLSNSALRRPGDLAAGKVGWEGSKEAGYDVYAWYANASLVSCTRRQVASLPEIRSNAVTAAYLPAWPAWPPIPQLKPFHLGKLCGKQGAHHWPTLHWHPWKCIRLSDASPPICRGPSGDIDHCGSDATMVLLNQQPLHRPPRRRRLPGFGSRVLRWQIKWGGAYTEWSNHHVHDMGV